MNDVNNLPPPPPPKPSGGRNNGKWVVVALVAMGVIAGVAAVQFRKMPGRTTTRPATTQVAP